MTPKTCSGCRFWSDKADDPRDVVRECRHPALHNAWEWPFDFETARGNGDSTGIRTGPEFGCVHWSDKSPPMIPPDAITAAW